jgi:uncharacterized protein (DUF58 family)
METTDLLRKVRKIEIKSRGLSRQIFSGQYHSAFKGKGMAFSEVREYQFGDDIRSIDWNVTARFNHPYVKVFEEERELTVMLLIDVSQSNAFGSRQQLKREQITEIAAVLAFSAIQNNDKVGVVFFSDRIEKFIPPKKGPTHILRIIRELISFQPAGKGTAISAPLIFLINAIKKRCTAFVLSDFIDTGFGDALKIAARKHDLVGIRIVDQRESELPKVGLIKLRDNESGLEMLVDTSSAEVRETYKYRWKVFEKKLNELFLKNGIDVALIETGSDYIRPLIKLFKTRESRY